MNRRRQPPTTSPVLGLAGILVTGLILCLPGASRATIRYVDQATGQDVGSCGSVAQPCKNIQRAVNLSSSGDEIRVAAGTYTYDAALDLPPCSSVTDGTNVICIINKNLTIKGGFSTSSWTASQPTINLTVIDGEDLHRGVLVRGGSPTGLTMDGFTITRGLAQGKTFDSGIDGDDDTFAWGGGILADFGLMVLSNLSFTNNRALGGNTSGQGGNGHGGGLALRAVPAGSTVSHLTFENNMARGGTGPEKGGYGIGGGFITFASEVTGESLTFVSNVAIGGNSPGSGVTISGERADGQGGGLAIHLSSDANLSRVTAIGNQVLGGNAVDKAGGAFGGGVYTEQAVLTLADSDIRQNVAQGGVAIEGGFAAGGGFMSQDSTVVIERSLLIDNRSSGGDGASGGLRGSGGGGGAYVSRLFNPDNTLTIVNTIIADNLTETGSVGTIPGGGGGGLFLQGTESSLVHCTLARNRLTPGGGLQGEAIVMIAGLTPNVTDIEYSVVAGHTSLPGAYALRVKDNCTANLTTTIFSDNAGEDTFVDAGGTLNGTVDSVTAVDFVSPGSPNFDYHLRETSPLIDAAPGSTTMVDVDGQTRDAAPDVGADEATDEIFADGFESGNILAWSFAVL